MDKFWTGVGILLVTALVLLYTMGDVFGQGDVHFTDLETECRLGGQESVVSLQGRMITFNGHFPTQNTEADLDYRYHQTGDSVTLNILVDDVEQDQDFLDDCLASVVYDARSSRLDPGEYYIEVRHDGNRVNERIIEVK